MSMLAYPFQEKRIALHVNFLHSFLLANMYCKGWIFYPRGSFTIYYFGYSLPPTLPALTFSMVLKLTKSWHFWTTYLPHLVHVVIEWPLRGVTQTHPKHCNGTKKCVQCSNKSCVWSAAKAEEKKPIWDLHQCSIELVGADLVHSLCRRDALNVAPFVGFLCPLKYSPLK